MSHSGKKIRRQNIWKIHASIFPIKLMKRTKPMIASTVKELACEKQINMKQNK